MNGRFGAALVAFAMAAAIVSRAPLLPEFLVQLRDPNLLGGRLFSALLHGAGYAFILALCAALAGCTVLLCAWRARVRGATDWHATLAAALVAICLSGRAGVSIDPIGWLCAAAVCLLLDRDDDGAALPLFLVMAAWSVLQGGATLGAVLIFCAIAGKIADDAFFLREHRARVAWYGAAMLAGILQLHAWPWHAYGAHALYLDVFNAGAQRDLLWSGNITTATIGFAAVITVAAWYGLRRRGRLADALTFFLLLVLTLIDARMLPYFGIVAAPAAVDALASYYVLSRTFPRGGVLRYTPAVAACCAAFMAGLAVSEPKVVIWPEALGQPAHLISYLKAEHHPSRVLCTHPRWCDGLAAIVPGTQTVVDDRGGVTPKNALHVQYVVANALPHWEKSLDNNGIDTVIASQDDSIVALMATSGWHIRSSDATRVLLQR